MKLEAQAKRYKANLARNLIKGALGLEDRMTQIVAKDTGTLEEAITTDPLIDRNGLLTIDVGPDPVGYERFVELGVKGKTYTYRRNGRVVHVGVGQHFMAQALEDTYELIFNLLANTKK